MMHYPTHCTLLLFSLFVRIVVAGWMKLGLVTLRNLSPQPSFPTSPHKGHATSCSGTDHWQWVHTTRCKIVQRGRNMQQA